MRNGLSMMLIIFLLIAGCSQNDVKSSDTKSNEAKTVAKSDFPQKNIELIIPFPPGGGGDIVGRAVAKHINKHLPNEQSMIVINQPGSSGAIGTTKYLKAKPDGYQILLNPISLFTSTPLQKEVVFNYDSFEPLSKIATARQLLLVKEDAPWKSFEDWKDFVEKNPNKFNYGVTGVGSPPHLAMEILSEAIDIQVKNIAFEGAGPAKTALLGGHVDGVVAPINSSDRGSIRALFSFSEEQGDLTQDIPLLKESGYDIGMDVVQAIFVHKETPIEIQNILQGAIKKTLEDAEFIEDFKKTELDLTYANSETLKKEMEIERDKTEKVLKKLNMLK